MKISYIDLLHSSSSSVVHIKVFIFSNAQYIISKYDLLVHFTGKVFCQIQIFSILHKIKRILHDV